MPRYPRSFEEMIEAKNKIFPPVTFEKGKEFRPRPSDVIITPWSKSGTTWIQQIVHCLRSGGDDGFDDISRVSPWIEVAHALGIDLDADQGWEPRAFKSHYSYHAVPKGCRYIVSFREPQAVMVSYYRFYEGWLFEPGTVSLAEYLAPHLDRSKRKDYWTHLESWWARREDPNVLLLSYEQMREDLRPAVTRIADFIGIAADEALVDLTLERSSLDYMLEHKHQFNDLLHRQRSDEVGALPPGAGSWKVSAGAVDDERYRLTPEMLDTMARHWEESMGAIHGVHSYDQLTDLLRS
ncbi:MAG: sulfotransferase domain-containing protein [Acidimicrobiia bacterium]|nr:sulfotransferase domain-containing protein [Acidimicrobiia bacterium]MDH4307486.1 sulfotransferase domain-containing protein [Acidimicrobiia bacterium]MDH5293875.1 sulfotransferase domain-containing protein [Acidimicrobiia bacterium]